MSSVHTKDDWAGEQGKRWLANVERLESMLDPIGSALMERCAFTSGERVVDLGCGGGATTRAIAAEVAPGGEVLGLDVSPALIAHAETQFIAGVEPSYVCADASIVTLDDGPYDRLFSRFGSMFFDDLKRAFANLHRMVKSGGRVDLAVWAAPRDNAWMMELMEILRAHVEVPPAEPRAPGPFAFEDLAYLEEVLTAGGFSTMEVEPYFGQQAVGGKGATPEEAVAFVLGSLGVGRVLDEQPEAVRRAASSDLKSLFERNYAEREGPLFDCKAWLVSTTA